MEIKKKCALLALPVIWLFVNITPCSGFENAKSSGPKDILVVSGTITNTQGKGIKDAVLNFFLKGRKMELDKEITTGKDGTYEAELSLPPGALPKTTVTLQVSRSSYLNGQMALGISSKKRPMREDRPISCLTRVLPFRGRPAPLSGSPRWFL